MNEKKLINIREVNMKNKWKKLFNLLSNQQNAYLINLKAPCLYMWMLANITIKMLIDKRSK